MTKLISSFKASGYMIQALFLLKLSCWFLSFALRTESQLQAKPELLTGHVYNDEDKKLIEEDNTLKLAWCCNYTPTVSRIAREIID